MPAIPVQKGQPVTIGTLTVTVTDDQVALTDKKTHHQKADVLTETESFFFTPHVLTHHQINTDLHTYKTGELNPPLEPGQKAAASSMSQSVPETLRSEAPYAVTQEIIAAYQRATADGVIDKKEQKQFKKLEHSLKYLGHDFTEENLQPLVKLARAIAPGRGQ